MARLKEMMVIDAEARLPARRLLPLWLDLFRTVSRRQGPRQHDLAVRAPAVPPGGESAPQSAAHDPTQKDDFAAGISD
jgi:hypothetical protein